MGKKASVLNYVLFISLGLLVLMGIEGLVTSGGAFEFESYSIVGYIAQFLLVVLAVCLGIKVAGEAE